jgi:hypothetical protein
MMHILTCNGLGEENAIGRPQKVLGAHNINTEKDIEIYLLK